MSYKVQDSRTGSERQRQRPIMAVTISPALLAELDMLAKKYKMSRARIVEKCILLGLGPFRQQHEPKPKESEEDRKEVDETVEQRYMRKILFDFLDNEKWVSLC